MIDNPYLRFREHELTLNDYLAIDRTVLANERTLLAYGRTGLAMLAIGGSCIKFFESPGIEALGIAFIVAAIVVFARGWARFQRTQQYLAAALRRQTGAPQHPLRESIKAESDAEATSRESPPSQPPASEATRPAPASDNP